MVKKILFILLALFGLPFSGMASECLADVSGQGITAIEIAGGGTITFVVTNTSGTISGNAGTNEANENPVQLIYGYDDGTGMDDSPERVFNVSQP